MVNTLAALEASKVCRRPYLRCQHRASSALTTFLATGTQLNLRAILFGCGIK